MKKYIFSLWNGFSEEHDKEPNNDILDSLRKAKEEWVAAQNYFENVSDPELVDYAIYNVEAARRKFVYLLKQAKAKGIERRQVTLEDDY